MKGELSLINKFFNNGLNKYKKIIPEINYFSELYKNQEILRSLTYNLQKRYKNGELLNNLLPEAFGLCNEAIKRTLGINFYECQYYGGMALHDARIAELKTGEGKTYVSFLSAYLNSLTGKNIHIITSNEYLAKRDKKLMEKCYNLLGITVGISLQGMSIEEKKSNYSQNITYSTASEVGFDYLRDNLVYNLNCKVLNGLNYAIIDEADSILLDDARVPLILSSPNNEIEKDLYYKSNEFILNLSDKDYEFITKKEVQLTDCGIEKIENFFNIHLDNPLYYKIYHCINNALKAHMLMKKDRNYIITKENKLELIDSSTGRIAYGRQYCSGLHQAIECKEDLYISNYNKTVGSITYQNLFQEYSKICGMSGTAKTDEQEFKDIYNLDVIQIPTNLPINREDIPTKFYRTKEEKYEAAFQEIIKEPERPILVGCTTIKEAEDMSRILLNNNIKHKLLTAKNLEEEAKIISLSGRKGSITISTSIAGRGTDIMLEDGINKIGGLKVIGVGMGDNIRIDNQLRGRSGRQGDFGSSIFFVSLDEENINPLEDEKIALKILKLNLSSSKGIKKAKKIAEFSQKINADISYQARKNMAELDDFVHMIRLLLYKERDKILENNSAEMCIAYMAKTFSALFSDKFMTKKFLKQDTQIQITKIQNYFDKIIFKGQLKQENFSASIKEYQDYIINKMSNIFLLKATNYRNNIDKINKDIILFSIDEIIEEFLDNIESMRISYFLNPQRDKNNWIKSIENLQKQLLENLEVRILQRIISL